MFVFKAAMLFFTFTAAVELYCNPTPPELKQPNITQWSPSISEINLYTLVNPCYKLKITPHKPHKPPRSYMTDEARAKNTFIDAYILMSFGLIAIFVSYYVTHIHPELYRA